MSDSIVTNAEMQDILSAANLVAEVRAAAMDNPQDAQAYLTGSHVALTAVATALGVEPPRCASLQEAN